MTEHKRYRVLLVAIACDGEDVSEAYNAFKWVSKLAEVCDVTLLTEYDRGRRPPSEQVRNARVIEWEGREPQWLIRFDRFLAAAKPGYVPFYFRVRRQIRRLLESGDRFDVFHQLTPIALRYPTACYGFGIPYLVGPMAGSLPTPPGFVGETGSAPWYTYLRSLDGLRLRYDPWLQRSYRQAAAVLGSAPYVREILSPVTLQRFEVEFDVGIDQVEPDGKRRRLPESNRSIRLLHVGRAVRTKGLRDVVRAMAQLGDVPHLTLTSAGGGEELDICRREAEVLNVAEKISFLGQVPRQVVEKLYSEADILVYPSFREPGGGVVLEAMRRGLPIITTDIGGPGYLVTDESGIRVPARNPEQLATDLAQAIRRLANDPAACRKMGMNARQRVAEVGLWKNKIARVLRVYGEVIEGTAGCGPQSRPSSTDSSSG